MCRIETKNNNSALFRDFQLTNRINTVSNFANPNKKKNYKNSVIQLLHFPFNALTIIIIIEFQYFTLSQSSHL